MPYNYNDMISIFAMIRPCHNIYNEHEHLSHSMNTCHKAYESVMKYFLIKHEMLIKPNCIT